MSLRGARRGAKRNRSLRRRVRGPQNDVGGAGAAFGPLWGTLAGAARLAGYSPRACPASRCVRIRWESQCGHSYDGQVVLFLGHTQARASPVCRWLTVAMAQNTACVTLCALDGSLSVDQRAFWTLSVGHARLGGSRAW